MKPRKITQKWHSPCWGGGMACGGYVCIILLGSPSSSTLPFPDRKEGLTSKEALEDCCLPTKFCPCCLFFGISIFMGVWLVRKPTCDHVSQFSLGSKCQRMLHSCLYLEVSILDLGAPRLREWAHQLSASTIIMGLCYPQLQGAHGNHGGPTTAPPELK